MIDFESLEALTIPEGKVIQIAKDGAVLWRAVKWADDLDTGLEFRSARSFSISVDSPGWDGTLEYCNGKGWETWDGSSISSGKAESGQCIYIRGIGNTKITGEAIRKWTLIGTRIECNGNIEKLLDYGTVASGEHPVMSIGCYYNMFYGCTSLTKIPNLPATTLASYCYRNMFNGCTSLTTPPNLPATTLASYCYTDMFNGCTRIKVSSSLVGAYTKEYRIPTSGTGKDGTYSLTNMFSNTGGTFTGTPEINTTYYLDESNTIV